MWSYILKIILISLVLLIIVWINLPINITEFYRIKLGNEFAENILKYKNIHGELPSINDRAVLSKLNPIKPYESFYPQYEVIDNDNFKLIFIRGFDGPYLKYNTINREWKEGF